MLHFENKTKQYKLIIEYNKGILPMFKTSKGYPDEKPDKAKFCLGWLIGKLIFTLDISTYLPHFPMERTWPGRGAYLVPLLSCVKAAPCSPLPLAPLLLDFPDQPHKNILKRWDSCVLLWRFSSVKSTIKLNSIPFLEQTERNLLKWKIQNENSGTAIKSEF